MRRGYFKKPSSMLEGSQGILEYLNPDHFSAITASSSAIKPSNAARPRPAGDALKKVIITPPAAKLS